MPNPPKDDVSIIKASLSPKALRRVGATPDYRFSLANERTFLAWIRTALALAGGGLAIAQFLPPFRIVHLREAIAAVLMLTAAACAVRAVMHWAACEKAMRKGEDLPTSRFPTMLAMLVFVSVLALVIIAITGTLTT